MTQADAPMPVFGPLAGLRILDMTAALARTGPLDWDESGGFAEALAFADGFRQLFIEVRLQIRLVVE